MSGKAKVSLINAGASQAPQLQEQLAHGPGPAQSSRDTGSAAQDVQVSSRWLVALSEDYLQHVTESTGADNLSDDGASIFKALEQLSEPRVPGSLLIPFQSRRAAMRLQAAKTQKQPGIPSSGPPLQGWCLLYGELGQCMSDGTCWSSWPRPGCVSLLPPQTP